MVICFKKLIKKKKIKIILNNKIFGKFLFRLFEDYVLYIN